MKVELDRTIALPGSADTAWRVLGDVEAVAGCMPGAKITERVDDTHYKGTVSVRIGPAALTFRGEVEVRALDAAARMLQLVGKGTDSSGSSVASMDLTATVEPGDATSSTLRGHSVVSMGGKAATFGARMMDAVADQILKQFSTNFVARVTAAAAASSNPAGAKADPGDVPGAPLIESPPPAAPPANELNGLALAWAVMKSWLRGLFSKSSS